MLHVFCYQSVIHLSLSSRPTMSLPVSHAVIFSPGELSLYIYCVVEALERGEGIAISWKLDAEANREARLRQREIQRQFLWPVSEDCLE